MPPRKKAAASAVPTRTSARNASKAVAAAAAASDSSDAPKPASQTKSAVKPTSTSKAKPASKAKPSSSKGKAKRAHSDDEDDDKDKDNGQPDAKKAKTDVQDDKAADSDKKDAPAKMVTVIKRGAAPVDPHSGCVATHQVYADGEAVWDAMLNQTNVGKNANKFYVLQLLHPIGDPNHSILFTRWGRVGEGGQQQRKGPFSPATAVQEFKKQFKAKTSTNWENRHGMVAKSGKYMWLERAFDDEEEAGSSNGKGKDKDEDEKDKEPQKIPESTLASEVQVLCRLIFSARLIEAHLSSMNYDANKLPLGKLAKSTILSGFAALKSLAEVLSQPDGDAAKALGGFRAATEELTGRYYSIIPHAFGRNRPPVISELVTLKKELELVDALGDMEVASKLIASTIPKDVSGNPVNPLDAHFRSLQLTAMDPIARSSSEFIALEAYARDTHGETHKHLHVDVQNAFRVERKEETEAWLNSGFDKLEDGERLLLWHGSRTTNFAGILSQGLRIAPPEAPVTGYMFGKGVYFADMMSKSANYCYAHLSDNTGVLLLCEVAAKPFYELKAAQYDADKGCKNANKRATLGLGRTRPVEWQDAGETLQHDALKGCHMPKGRGQNVDDPGTYLQYNEYIVYDPSQIRVRYLLMVKMG